ncbi:hypothetical protein J6590_054525 [Homalodisca vitripennis]|nr:hypothetical protein J6590_054525 [Homalodisca vitripennis]
MAIVTFLFYTSHLHDTSKLVRSQTLWLDLSFSSLAYLPSRSRTSCCHDYSRLVVDIQYVLTFLALNLTSHEGYEEAHQIMWSVVCRQGIRGSSPDYVVSSLQSRDTRKLTRLCGHSPEDVVSSLQTRDTRKLTRLCGHSIEDVVSSLQSWDTRKLFADEGYEEARVWVCWGRYDEAHQKMWAVVCNERYDEAHQKMWLVVCRRGIRGSSSDYVVSSWQTNDTMKLTRRCGHSSDYVGSSLQSRDTRKLVRLCGHPPDYVVTSWQTSDAMKLTRLCGHKLADERYDEAHQIMWSLADERYDEAHQKMWAVVCSRGIRGSSPDYVVTSWQTSDTMKLTRRCGQ